VAPRWIETKERFAFAETAQTNDDWLLMSGEFVVGRVMRDWTNPQAGRFSWFLTGPQGSPIDNHGITDTFEEAQDALLASWRRWHQWAGMRDA
jgi:hypothetical protein